MATIGQGYLNEQPWNGEVVSYEGSAWQARQDTAQAPGGSDWVCLSRHGRDAITPTVRGNHVEQATRTGVGAERSFPTIS